MKKLTETKLNFVVPQKMDRCKSIGYVSSCET
jgi:hypothetical protein